MRTMDGLLPRTMRLLVVLLLGAGCKAKATPQEAARTVAPVAQTAESKAEPAPSRTCNTMEENKQALDDIKAAISGARALAQAGKLSEARAEGEKAKQIEEACFGALDPRTNWARVEGRLYSIDALRRFPDLPSEWRPKCARKADILSKNSEQLLCGPDFAYYVDPGASTPFALEVTAMGEDDPPSSADACQAFVERTIPDLTASATVNNGSVRIKFYKKAAVLVRAGWTRMGKTTFCFVSSCREDLGKGPHGGKCAIPDTAKMLRPVAVAQQTEGGNQEADSLSLHCEVDKETQDGVVAFPHAGDPPGFRLPIQRYVLDGDKLNDFVGATKSPSRLTVIKHDPKTVIATSREKLGGVVTNGRLVIDRAKMKATNTYVTIQPPGARSFMTGSDISGRHETVFFLSCRTEAH